MASEVEGFTVSAVLSLLQSRLLRPVFVTLGIALLVQVLVAVALTRSTVTALEADLAVRLGADSQKLSGYLNDILLAQDYQDLTGQVIKRVTQLVTEVEGNLLKLVGLTPAPSGFPSTKP